MGNWCHCGRKTVHNQYVTHSDFIWVLDHYKLTDTYELCMLCLQAGCEPRETCENEEADDE